MAARAGRNLTCATPGRSRSDFPRPGGGLRTPTYRERRPDAQRLSEADASSRLCLAAGGLDLDLLGVGLAVLRGVGDPGDRRATQRSRVLTRYPVLPPKTVRLKWPIGASGTTGTVVCSRRSRRSSGLVVSARGHEVDLAVEDEGEARQAAGAGDGVDRAAERLVEQRRRRRRLADRACVPAHSVSTSSFSEQMLPRWRWSIAKACGRVTARDLMLASPGRVRRSKRSCGFFARFVSLRPPTCRTVIFGLKPSESAVDRVEVARRSSVTVPWSPIPWVSTAKWRAVGRVDREVRACRC